MTIVSTPRFSFMSANFLGREKNYVDVTGFGEHSKSIADAFSPVETYGERIDGLFSEISAMGYRGVDLWTAHCDPTWATPRHIEGLQAASAKHQVEIVSLAGGTGKDLVSFERTCRTARDIGCSLLGMGCPFLPDHIEDVQNILSRYGVVLGFENHPREPTPEVVLEKIGQGRYPNIRVTFDTGWWGTHDYPLDEAFEKLQEFIVLVHLKNVEAPVTHVAAPLDEGCLNLEPFVHLLRASGYSGWISLEYEPLAHNPTDDCRRFLTLAKNWWEKSSS